MLMRPFVWRGDCYFCSIVCMCMHIAGQIRPAIITFQATRYRAPVLRWGATVHTAGWGKGVGVVWGRSGSLSGMCTCTDTVQRLLHSVSQYCQGETPRRPHVEADLMSIRLTHLTVGNGDETPWKPTIWRIVYAYDVAIVSI